MKNKRILIELAFVFSVVLSAFSQSAVWVSSTDENRWVKKEPIKLIDFKNTDQVDIEVLTDQKQQTMDGWGGCFNELGWQAIQTLPFKERDNVIKAFFDPNEGLKYNFCRMPIGANDYSFTWYSLNETEGDFKMKNFSIERDKSILIPYIKAAMKHRPDLKIWASPWSPPTWMKTNYHYANKPNVFNDLTDEKAVKSGDQFIQKKEYLAAYALYLAKFVKAYQNQGINIHSIHIQNEPYTYNQWPNCSWTARGMRDFISMYLGPKFVKDKIPSQIWFGTINNANVAVFDSVLSQPNVRKYISGVGFQYEGKDALVAVAKKYPELNLMQTETPCGYGSFDWKSAESTFKEIKLYLDRGAKSYMYWNMILDTTGESTWGWRQNAQVTIDKYSKKVTYTPEYYIFKHLSYYVVPGSVKLQTKGRYGNVLSFVTPEGKIVLVTVNTSNNPVRLKIKVNTKILDIELPEKSFNTLSM